MFQIAVNKFVHVLWAAWLAMLQWFNWDIFTWKAWLATIYFCLHTSISVFNSTGQRWWKCLCRVMCLNTEWCKLWTELCLTDKAHWMWPQMHAHARLTKSCIIPLEPAQIWFINTFSSKNWSPKFWPAKSPHCIRAFFVALWCCWEFVYANLNSPGVNVQRALQWAPMILIRKISDLLQVRLRLLIPFEKPSSAHRAVWIPEGMTIFLFSWHLQVSNMHMR